MSRVEATLTAPDLVFQAEGATRVAELIPLPREGATRVAELIPLPREGVLVELVPLSEGTLRRLRRGLA